MAATTPQSPQDAPSELVRLNTHGVAGAGLVGGSVSLGLIIVAVARLFHDLSDGGFLLSIASDHVNHAFGPATAELVACGFGILGACVLTALSGLAAYLGRPKTIP